MIIIKGKDRHKLLESLAYSRPVNEREWVKTKDGKGTVKPQNDKTYQHIFSCEPAIEDGDALILKTYNDRANMQILRNKEIKEGFEVEIKCQ